MASSSLLPSAHMKRIYLPLYLLYSVPTTLAYTWSFQNTPQQCKDLTIQIHGDDGVPPYSVLILPFGPSPLNVEARRNIEVKSQGQDSNITFQLKYPENSNFVAVVSDSKQFASGGTSVGAQVTSSDDDSCFDTKNNVSPIWAFSIEPANLIVQCSDMRIWWDPAVVQGNPDFLGVIPGGQSFVIPQGKITQVPSQGMGFTYKPSVRAGTYMYIVAGDNRGNGTGGAFGTTVAAGINTDNSCLSNNSPSSTPGSPAGGSYATGTNGAGTVGNTGGASGGSSGKSSTNIGAIVGGVIGGVVLFIVALLLFWFYRRRQKKYRRTKERPVDLLNAEDDGDDSPDHVNGRTRANELPEYYRPEPFMVPDPTADGASVNGTEEDGRRPLSGTANSFYTRDGTPEPHSASMSGFGPGIGGSSVGGERRKGGAPRPMRAVNIIQHDDAGPSLPKESEDEPETIELPPAYTAVGKTKSPEGSPSPPVRGATAAAGAAEPPAAAQ